MDQMNIRTCGIPGQRVEGEIPTSTEIKIEKKYGINIKDGATIIVGQTGLIDYFISGTTIGEIGLKFNHRAKNTCRLGSSLCLFSNKHLSYLYTQGPNNKSSNASIATLRGKLDHVMEELCQDPQAFEEKVVVSGNPELGVIVMIRQYHEPATAEGDNSQNALSKELAAVITEYQYAIFKYLAARDYEVLMSEGVTEAVDCKFPPTSPSHFNIGYYEEYQAAPEEHKNVFSKDSLGVASKAYAEIRCHNAKKSTQVLASEDEALLKQAIKTVFSSAVRAAPTAQAALDIMRPSSQAREEFIIQKALEYLKQNPGQVIPIVLGLHHSFRDDLSKLDESKRPVLVEVSFPQLEKKFERALKPTP